MIRKVMISRFLGDHVDLWSCGISEAGAIAFEGSERTAGRNWRGPGSTAAWHAHICAKSAVSALRESQGVATKVGTVLIENTRLIRIGLLALHLTEASGQRLRLRNLARVVRAVVQIGELGGEVHTEVSSA